MTLNQPPEGGFLHVLPMHLPEGLTVEAAVASILPWAAPCLTAQRGHALDSEPVLVIGYEWSAPWVHTVEQISKQHREFLHVQRFTADYLATGALPFWNLAEGADPPDWVAENQDGSLGVECAQLTVQERRTAQALFLGLRQKLLSRLGGPLPYLMNHVVYFWFDGPGGLELPLKKGDEDAIADLAQALLAHRPDPARLWHEGGIPEHLPAPDLVRTPAGAVFHCAPMANAVPTTPLYTSTGIEVGFVYTTLHQRSDAWARVQKLVDDHDQEGVDWLVLSAGAPNQHGIRFLSEEALAHFLVDQPLDLPEPRHIRRVTLHIWSEGLAVDVYPTLSPIFGPIYQGFVAPHQPLVPRRAGDL